MLASNGPVSERLSLDELTDRAVTTSLSKRHAHRTNAETCATNMTLCRCTCVDTQRKCSKMPTAHIAICRP